MIIFLGIILELITIIGSLLIGVNGVINSVIEIAKRGYKIDKKALDEVQNKVSLEKNHKNNLAKSILDTILFLLPGINLINASIRSIVLKKTTINDPEIREIFIPMSETEKEQYAQLENRFEKLAYTILCNIEETNEEVVEQSQVIESTKDIEEELPEPKNISLNPDEIILKEQQGPKLIKKCIN